MKLFSWDSFTSNSHFLVAREISPSPPPTLPKDLELDTSPQPKTTLFPGPFSWNMVGTEKALGISLKWRDHRHHIKHEKYRGRARVGAEGWNYGCHNLFQVLSLSIVIKFLTDASSYWLTACLATLKKKNVNVWYWSNWPNFEMQYLLKQLFFPNNFFSLFCWLSRNKKNSNLIDNYW